MDFEILKKKISSYRSEGGRLRNVSDELLIEILVAWEQWTGPAKGFYSSLGIDHKRMAVLIGKAKKLKREGFPTDGFKEVKIDTDPAASTQFVSGGGIEVSWSTGKIIRFPNVDQLIDFLKKVA